MLGQMPGMLQALDPLQQGLGFHTCCMLCPDCRFEAAVYRAAWLLVYKPLALLFGLMFSLCGAGSTNVDLAPAGWHAAIGTNFVTKQAQHMCILP